MDRFWKIAKTLGYTLLASLGAILTTAPFMKEKGSELSSPWGMFGFGVLMIVGNAYGIWTVWHSRAAATADGAQACPFHRNGFCLDGTPGRSCSLRTARLADCAVLPILLANQRRR